MMYRKRKLSCSAYKSLSVVQFKDWKEILSELGGAGLFGIYLA